MSITTVATLRSIHEIDHECRVKRIVGLAPPTGNQERYADGWTPYLSVAWLGSALLFAWEIDSETQEIWRTLRFTAVALDGPLTLETARIGDVGDGGFE